MAIVLFRVDERLIHGQVVVGWGTSLHPQLIVVVDDDLAGAPWEQELYCLGLPPQLETRFASVDDARRELPGWQGATTRIIVLTRDVRSMRRLLEGLPANRVEVNIGGIHFAPGRRASSRSRRPRVDWRPAARPSGAACRRPRPGSC